MKTVDKYVKFKSMYKDYVVIIKSGNFYYSFGEDAFILKYFFNYQIRDDKVGFPTNAKAKVKSVLNRNNVNLIEIIDDYAYVLETKNQNEYAEAQRLIEMLKYFRSIPSEYIPNNSLLKEFLGGGYFEY